MNFSKTLLEWYSQHKRDLPWRRSSDPYQIWISEIMLQQTTVATVIPRFKHWVKVFPDMKDLAKSSLQKVLTEWQGLGYYNRAKNLHRAAQIMCRRHQGQIPREKHVLLALPGFGPYTAGAVLSIAYQQPISIIDANIRRVIMRMRALHGKPDGKTDKKIYTYLDRVMPRRSPGNFNQALMELGALICRQRKPLCLQCPIRSHCLAYHQGRQEMIPLTIKKKLKNIYAVIALIEKNRRYLIQKRPSHGLLGDLWEFPGGKIEKGETARSALRREITEEVGCEIQSTDHYMTTRHFYTEYNVHLDVWKCRVISSPRLKPHQRWVSLHDFSRYPFASGSVKIIEKLRKE